MFQRIAVVVVALLTAACVPSSEETLPSTQVASGPASSQPVTSVPPAGWHAMLVAGDNNSPAFDNGVDTLRDRLGSMGVRDIRLYSGTSSGTTLATSANVLRGLRSVGGEACFVYVTSHGEERGFYLRADRRIFGPDALNSALTEGCGAAPTVVVVSACHSGTFINSETRRPNRIILTAAATDRTSFGCGADDDYTYYDQCFLQQLDGARTWRDVALGTKSCVETLERRLGVRRESRPQMFFGSAVADLHLPGR
ncbi:Peptidase C13 family protein [Enhydrobacter aerosaccus]|uniref:Peptidase C13 family protein n=1 Tax=Enhydrobacter aerosaccus TaxID=225324 RepID=A0A1T4T7U0_9HYPH|nr:C13 family peptidase [Enhydrobacter aerosaccus]SKA36590.1 Peptidase C13 family protein [Enhydrobacter aerosaccus]